MEGDFDDKTPKAQAKVSWAVVFLRAKVFYEEELNFAIRIFGIPVYDSRKDHWSVLGEHPEKDKKKNKKKHKKKSISEKKSKKEAKQNKQEIKQEKHTVQEQISDKKVVREAKDITIKKTSEDVFDLTWDEKEESTKKDKEFFGKKIVNLLKKCYNKCKNLITKIRKITDKMETVGDILEDEDIINAIKKVLGWAAVLIPIYGDRIDITPDFEKRTLKGHLKIKGSIRRYKILQLLWKIYKDKDELIKQKDRALRMIGGN